LLGIKIIDTWRQTSASCRLSDSEMSQILPLSFHCTLPD